MVCLFLQLKSVCHLRPTWVAAAAARFCTTSSLPSRVSPWLMLPPFCGDGRTFNNFYNLAQNKVVTMAAGEEVAGGDTAVVGLSHGWLALFKERSSEIFLWNPLSRGRINLPPIQESKGIGFPVKMILSCSPDGDGDGCRAVMSYAPELRLAVCTPGLSKEWTPFGARFHDDDEETKIARVYEDFAFSGIHNRLFIITQWGIFERWNLHGKDIPTQEWSHDLSYSDSDSDSDYDYDALSTYKYVVISEHSGEVFLLFREIMHYMGPDGSPYKTVGFNVYKMDGHDMSFQEETLDGLAMFVGINHSFAVKAADFPELKPDSIYFTDAYGSCDDDYGGHDIGIFCYKSRTLFPCYYPLSPSSLIVPPPFWFTPN